MDGNNISMKYDDIKNILSEISDPVQRLELVMDFGNDLSPVPQSAVCTEIKGCSSFAQICRDGTHFYGNADSAMVRGILAIVLSMVDGKSTDQIKSLNLGQQFKDLNLNLGASRINGVNSMLTFLENL